MAAMLHARNNSILFLWDKMFIPNAKHFHCSWHATWPPCKTSIAGICPFKETFDIHDFIKPKKTRQIAHYVYVNELAVRAL